MWGPEALRDEEQEPRRQSTSPNFVPRRQEGQQRSSKLPLLANLAFARLFGNGLARATERFPCTTCITSFGYDYKAAVAVFGLVSLVVHSQESGGTDGSAVSQSA